MEIDVEGNYSLVKVDYIITFTYIYFQVENFMFLKYIQF